MSKLIRVLAIALLMLPTVAGAQDFERGWAAYEAGDYEGALREWRPLAEKGDALAQNNLGGMYFNGNGVVQDYAEAVRWIRLAAEQGYVGAQFNLGVMYDNGAGLPEDDVEAARWYRLAAEQAHAWAQNNLAVMYEYGRGVAQDNHAALMWYAIASENGASESAKWRDGLAQDMTPVAVEEALDRARVCMESGYADCD